MEKEAHIGILKHESIGYAEEVLCQILETSGLTASIIKPQELDFGEEDTYPDLVVARCELSSSSDAILPVYLAYYEECRGRSIPVINSSEFLIRGQNKYTTHVAVHNHLVNQGIEDHLNPKFWFACNRKKAFAIAVKELERTGSVVIKAIFSGRGEGVYLANNRKELKEILRTQFADHDSIMIQEVIEKDRGEGGNYRDIRAHVCRNPVTNEAEVISACYRNAGEGQFMTNICQGGAATKIENIDDDLRRYASLVMEATQGDIAGLDFARDQNGQYKFFEVNFAFETSRDVIEVLSAAIWERVRDLVLARLN